MSGKTLVLGLGAGVVMLGSIVLLGRLHLLHSGEGYMLVGVPVIGIELSLALLFARCWVLDAFAGFAKDGRARGILVASLALIAAAMPPTFAILTANQAFDNAPGVMQTLPVLRTYSDIGRGSTTYYAAVPAPPPPLLAWSGAEGHIRLPRATWQKLVAGRSTLTLKVHPGRFGLPWYDLVAATS